MLTNKICPAGRYCVGGLHDEADAVDCSTGHYCPNGKIKLLFYYKQLAIKVSTAHWSAHLKLRLVQQKAGNYVTSQCTTYFGQIKNWLFCVSLATCSCHVWRNMLSYICQSIRCHFKRSVIAIILVFCYVSHLTNVRKQSFVYNVNRLIRVKLCFPPKNSCNLTQLILFE